MNSIRYRAPLFILFIRIRRFNRVQRFKHIRSNHPRSGHTHIIRIVTSTHPIHRFTLVIPSWTIAITLTIIALPCRLLRSNIHILRPFLMYIRHFNRRNTFNIPYLLTIKGPTFSLFRSFNCNVALPTHLISILTRTLGVLTRLLRATTISTLSAFLSNISSHIRLTSTLRHPVSNLLQLLSLTLHNQRADTRFTNRTQTHPYKRYYITVFTIKISKFMFTSFTNLLYMFTMTYLSILRSNSTNRFIFRTIRIFIRPIMIISNFINRTSKFKCIRRTLLRSIIRF